VFCVQHDVEFLVWRVCFYQPVEILKVLMAQESQNLIQELIVELVKLIRFLISPQGA
jgi:hypothetical protein